MTPTQRLTDRKRAAILQAATAEFRQNGFDATSMDRIAARAEVSKRTVYNHFASKDALFTEILLQLWHNSQNSQEAQYRSDAPLPSQLRLLMQAKMAMLNDAPFMDLARVAIAETVHAPDRAREMVTRMGEREENITAWIRAAQADGRLKAGDPAFAACQLQSLIKAFAFWPQITLGQPPLDAAMQRQVVDSAVDLFLAHYAVDPAASRSPT
ncbi:MAG: TetR/AcrR family transcriptional regulator [Paludibacterium sp.]|uniref:TetR/AcrR family transcriptional regulator n=1 Tax=Paludibacterium sp. TaxID=1917523 RepID=UPI0025E3DDA0|nr:TetR/AcrR family transcriptional regulator [Paludibacterium sp.]MBV8046190.1 TetR/AcrR family transcriptional regulator [Paludibacterium sp.]MBV8649315.1 TetR/AcrR family transcriptional regulator [Paludibacterium sp.]